MGARISQASRVPADTPVEMPRFSTARRARQSLFPGCSTRTSSDSSPPREILWMRLIHRTPRCHRRRHAWPSYLSPVSALTQSALTSAQPNSSTSSTNTVSRIPAAKYRLSLRYDRLEKFSVLVYTETPRSTTQFSTDAKLLVLYMQLMALEAKNTKLDTSLAAIDGRLNHLEDLCAATWTPSKPDLVRTSTYHSSMHTHSRSISREYSVLSSAIISSARCRPSLTAPLLGGSRSEYLITFAIASCMTCICPGIYTEECRNAEPGTVQDRSHRPLHHQCNHHRTSDPDKEFIPQGRKFFFDQSEWQL